MLVMKTRVVTLTLADGRTIRVVLPKAVRVAVDAPKDVGIQRERRAA